jgi:hypothetical protein
LLHGVSYLVRLEALTVMAVKLTVKWDVILSSLRNIYLTFQRKMLTPSSG